MSAGRYRAPPSIRRELAALRRSTTSPAHGPANGPGPDALLTSGLARDDTERRGTGSNGTKSPAKTALPGMRRYALARPPENQLF